MSEGAGGGGRGVGGGGSIAEITISIVRGPGVCWELIYILVCVCPCRRGDCMR